MSEQPQICKKVNFRTEEGKCVTLLGLIEGEDDYLIMFRTRNNLYRLAKDSIISIKDTNVFFQGEKKEDIYDNNKLPEDWDDLLKRGGGNE